VATTCADPPATLHFDRRPARQVRLDARRREVRLDTGRRARFGSTPGGSARRRAMRAVRLDAGRRTRFGSTPGDAGGSARRRAMRAVRL
jgi:hypothetical protein